MASATVNAASGSLPVGMDSMWRNVALLKSQRRSRDRGLARLQRNMLSVLDDSPHCLDGVRMQQKEAVTSPEKDISKAMSFWILARLKPPSLSDLSEERVLGHGR